MARQLNHSEPEKLSLLTLSLHLNSTTNNQGNHCILACNRNAENPAYQENNQVLYSTSVEKKCQSFGNISIASKWQEWCSQLFSGSR